MDSGGKKGLTSDINVTPLVDVVLVLLIIFMVVTPLTQRGYDIDIPRASDIIDGPPPEQVILAISEADCRIARPLAEDGLPSDCRVRINKEVVRIGDLSSKMNEIFKNRKAADRILFIAAQEKLNYEAVVRIVDRARTGVGEGLRLGVVTDEKLALRAATDG